MEKEFIFDNAVLESGIYKIYYNNVDYKDIKFNLREKLKENNNLLYIGMASKSILFRLGFHFSGLKSNSTFRRKLEKELNIKGEDNIDSWLKNYVKITFQSFPKDSIRQKEKEMIETLRPLLNKSYKSKLR